MCDDDAANGMNGKDCCIGLLIYTTSSEIRSTGVGVEQPASHSAAWHFISTSLMIQIAANVTDHKSTSERPQGVTVNGKENTILHHVKADGPQ